MKFTQKVAKLTTLMMAMFFVAGVAVAAPKTLIEMPGPKAGLAKSWKKVKDGEYEFTLDTTQELKKGVNVSPDAVKSSLESKLGGTHGVKVTAKGKDGVTITYTGKEDDFLDQVSKTKIREKSVELALESSVSEGGIRAKTIDRPPNANEVKVIVLKAEKGVVTAKVNASKSDKIKSGVIKLKDAGTYKANDWLYFQPDAKAGDVWNAVAGTVTTK